MFCLFSAPILALACAALANKTLLALLLTVLSAVMRLARRVALSFVSRSKQPVESGLGYNKRIILLKHNMPRADVLLVSRGLAVSRTAAQHLIDTGRVYHGPANQRHRVGKPSAKLDDDVELYVEPRR